MKLFILGLVLGYIIAKFKRIVRFIKKFWDKIPDVLGIMGIIVGPIWLYKKNVVTSAMLLTIAISQILWAVIDIEMFFKERRKKMEDEA